MALLHIPMQAVQLTQIPLFDNRAWSFVACVVLLGPVLFVNKPVTATVQISVSACHVCLLLQTTQLAISYIQKNILQLSCRSHREQTEKEYSDVVYFKLPDLRLHWQLALIFYPAPENEMYSVC